LITCFKNKISDDWIKFFIGFSSQRNMKLAFKYQKKQEDLLFIYSIVVYSSVEFFKGWSINKLFQKLNESLCSTFFIYMFHTFVSFFSKQRGEKKGWKVLLIIFGSLNFKFVARKKKQKKMEDLCSIWETEMKSRQNKTIKHDTYLKLKFKK